MFYSAVNPLYLSLSIPHEHTLCCAHFCLQRTRTWFYSRARLPAFFPHGSLSSARNDCTVSAPLPLSPPAGARCNATMDASGGGASVATDQSASQLPNVRRQEKCVFHVEKHNLCTVPTVLEFIFSHLDSRNKLPSNAYLHMQHTSVPHACAHTHIHTSV